MHALTIWGGNVLKCHENNVTNNKIKTGFIFFMQNIEIYFIYIYIYIGVKCNLDRLL